MQTPELVPENLQFVLPVRVALLLDPLAESQEERG